MKTLTALAAALALTTMALAGCIGTDEDEVDDPLDPAALPTVDGPVAFQAEDVVPLPDAWAGLSVGLFDIGFNGAEPTIGVTSDGTIFTTASGADLARSSDNGKSWELVSTPTTGLENPKVSLDPWMWVDPLTDRVFDAPLYVVCTWAAWSDDLGETWDFNPITGCGVPAHDHQKLTTGPPAEGVTTDGYPDVIYYQYNSFREEGSWVSTSYDGGRTYSIGQAAHPSSCHGGVAGPVAVAPDGTAYLPKPACDGLNIAVSRDSGQSWEVTGEVNGAGIYEPLATTVDAAVDSAGNAYAVYGGGDGRIYMTRSLDAGATWSEPFVVSPPEVTVTVFSVIAAGGPGEIVIGYHGTTADASKWDGKDAQSAPDDTVWHLYMTFSEDAAADDPVFVSRRVTPEDDPVQVGCVWLSGGRNDCRNLADFIDVVQHDGRAYLVYADGCDKCTTASDSRGRAVTVAIVDTGPSLLDGVLVPLDELGPAGGHEHGPEGVLAGLLGQ